MSFFNLRLINKSENRIVLTVPLASRIVLLLFAALVISTFILDPGFSFIPVFILIILLLSAFYKERWEFDRDRKEILYGFGLLFFYKKTVVPFNLIEEFHFEGFVKGSMTKKPSTTTERKKKFFETEYFKLTLINEKYGELTINTVKGRDRERLYENARSIASLCESELTK